MHLAIRLLRCTTFAVLIWLTVPFLCNMFPAGAASDQAWLRARCVEIEEILVTVPISDELEDLLTYTLRRYNTVGRFNVAIRRIPMADCVGINAPWCPGITLEPEVLEMDNIMGTNILVHEACHDYYPYFGHAHVDPIMDEFIDAQMKLWDIKRKSQKIMRRCRREN